MEKKKRKRGSPLGAVLLILIGVILLLNVFGVLDWSIWWSLLRLWPVLLIAAGLELLLGRWKWGSLLATILVVAVVVAALWLTSAGVTTSGLVTEQIRQPLGDATRADVSIEPRHWHLADRGSVGIGQPGRGHRPLGQGRRTPGRLFPTG